MTGAAVLNRRIIIQAKTVSRNALNEPIETWNTVTTIFAGRMDASAAESYRAQEVGGELSIRWTIRSSETTRMLTPGNHRIIYLGEVLNITGVRETQRNRWMEVDTVRRDDAAPTDVTGSP